MSVYGTSVVKRLSKAQARELDHHLQALVEHHEAEAEKYLPKGAYGEPSTAPRQRLPGQGGNAPEDARQLQGLCGPLSAFAKAGPRACPRACRSLGWFCKSLVR